MKENINQSKKPEPVETIELENFEGSALALMQTNFLQLEEQLKELHHAREYITEKIEKDGEAMQDFVKKICESNKKNYANLNWTISRDHTKLEAFKKIEVET